MALTREQKVEILREHPDTIELEFPRGTTRKFHLGKWSFDLAKEQGYSLGQVLGEVEEESGSLLEAGLESTAVILYAGLLPFEPDLDIEEVEIYLSVGEVQRLEPILEEIMSVDVDEPEMEGNEPPEGGES